MTPRSFSSIAAPLALTAGLAAGPALAETILVTETGDDGDGTLRQALAEAASSDAATWILVVAEGDIAIASTLAYDGTSPVAIYGDGQTVAFEENADILAVTEGADLTVQDLTFQGPGGFSIEARGDDGDETPGKGIFVDVPEDREGLVSVVLSDITVAGVANHGIHVSDCSLADECGGGAGGEGEGSPAAIMVHLAGVEVRDVGNGTFDADGLRVDERGEGGVTLTSANSTFTGVGADGVEVDEGQAGTVTATHDGDTFTQNGAYCDPEILEPLMPAEPEGEFAEGEMQEADIPEAPTGTPDDGCFEREVSTYEDGSVEEYEIGIDLDDGYDIDEAGEGDLRALVVASTITDNLDEGLDFDEAGPGDIELFVWRSEATGNTDDGWKSSEEGAGGITGVVQSVVAEGNGGVGVLFEEAGAGDVQVTIRALTTSGNDDGEDTGVEVVAEDDGEGSLSVASSDIAEGITAEGVEVTER